MNQIDQINQTGDQGAAVHPLKGIRRRLIAEGTAVGTEGIVQAVWLEGASSSEGIGRGIRIVRIRAQFAEIFRVEGERQGQQQEQKEEDTLHGEPRIEHVANEFSLLPAWKSVQAGQQRLLTHFPSIQALKIEADPNSLQTK